MGERITKVEKFIRWCQNHKWISIVLIIGIIIIALADFTDALEKICSLFKSSSQTISISNTNAPSEVEVKWQPPELPPGCSNVTVWFGTWRMDEPMWLAKTPHQKSDTNYFGTNSFTVHVSPNLNLTMYHWGDIATDSNAIRYAITNLPPAFVTNAEKMPDFSPRKRSESFNNQAIKTPWFNGKQIEFPVWPLVVSNRLFVDVLIPFINERHLVLMDANLDNALTNLPSRWDVNYNSNQFEIVNEEASPVLQVIYKSPSEVQVNGIYVVNGFDVYAAFNSAPVSFIEEMGNQPTQMMEIEDFEKLHTNISVKIMDTNTFFRSKFPTQKAIFKYPSWKFFHQLAN